MSRDYLKVGDYVKWYNWDDDDAFFIAYITEYYVITPRGKEWNKPGRVGGTGWIILIPVVEIPNTKLMSGGNV